MENTNQLEPGAHLVPSQIPAEQASKPTRGYQKHGFTPLKKAISSRGLGALDGRSRASKALLAWRDELIQDLGGPDLLSVQQVTVIELAVRTRILLDYLDTWIMSQGLPVNRKRKSAWPVLKDRQQLADSLARYLSTLGLEKKTKVLSLNDYLASKPANPEPHASREKPGEEATAE